MFKNRFIGVMAVLAVVVLLAVAYSFVGVLASNPESAARSDALSGANQAGIYAYNQSEWADYRGVPSRVIAEGMAIYQQSERSPASIELAASNEGGMAIYHQSERSSALIKSTVSNDAGMAVYHQSERHGAAALPARLYNGEPFNAYQQSEWLGAER